MPKRSVMARTRCSPSQNHDAPRSSGSDRSRPPMRGRASSTVTVRPLRCTASATANPLMPAPMTTTSDWRTCCSLPDHSSRWALCQWPNAKSVMPVKSSPRSLRLHPPLGSGIDGELTRETALQMLGNGTYRWFHSRQERTTSRRSDHLISPAGVLRARTAKWIEIVRPRYESVADVDAGVVRCPDGNCRGLLTRGLRGQWLVDHRTTGCGSDSAPTDRSKAQPSAGRELSDWMSNVRGARSAVIREDIVAGVVVGATLDTSP